MVAGDLRLDVIQTIQLMRINAATFGSALVSHVSSSAFQSTILKYIDKDSSRPYMSSSPQASAPIQDLLMRSSSSK